MSIFANSGRISVYYDWIFFSVKLLLSVECRQMESWEGYFICLTKMHPYRRTGISALNCHCSVDYLNFIKNEWFENIDISWKKLYPGINFVALIYLANGWFVNKFWRWLLWQQLKTLGFQAIKTKIFMKIGCQKLRTDIYRKTYKLSI